MCIDSFLRPHSLSYISITVVLIAVIMVNLPPMTLPAFKQIKNDIPLVVSVLKRYLDVDVNIVVTPFST